LQQGLDLHYAQRLSELQDVDYAKAVRPTQCTLVPDSPDAFTSNHGWDLAADGGNSKTDVVLGEAAPLPKRQAVLDLEVPLDAGRCRARPHAGLGEQARFPCHSRRQDHAHVAAR